MPLFPIHPLGPHAPDRTLRRSAPRGVTLPEALISLSICATLLTAMGSAFVATAHTITANDNFASANQIARSAIVMMEKDIRHSVPALGGTASSLTLTIGAATKVYAFDSANKKLTLTTGGATTTLASNISACKFLYTNGSDTSGNALIAQVGITLTTTVGNDSITLSGSATPRKNLNN